MNNINFNGTQFNSVLLRLLLIDIITQIGPQLEIKTITPQLNIKTIKPQLKISTK